MNYNMKELEKEYDKLQLKYGAKEYKFYSLCYPVGNGRFNIDKSIEDINWIIENEIANKISV